VNLPSIVNIAGFKFSIIQKKKLQWETDDGIVDMQGFIDYTHRFVKICKNMPLQTGLATIVHEAVHGILHTAGIHDHNEQEVTILGYGITQFIRDNPELVKMIQEET
jgi:hypothetical protein